MEHLDPHPLVKAAAGTPAAEALRLIALPPYAWTAEDLNFSEAAQRALMAFDYPVRLVAQLSMRHRDAAALLLRRERDGAAPGPVLCADSRTRARFDHLMAIERIELALRLAGGAR